MSKQRTVVLQVTMRFDEWTAKTAGTDSDIMDDLREGLTDGYLGGAAVTVQHLASTEGTWAEQVARGDA